VSAAIDLIEWGPERARAGHWRGERAVAYLSPAPGAPAPSAGFVRRCLAALAERGFTEVVTGALAPAEQRGFLAAGFEVRERLLLLAHDLDHLPAAPRGPWRLRRARRRHRRPALAVDARAFRPFWRFDDTSLDEALRATPARRFRIAALDGGVVGYAVSGRAARQGYLQRLAVDPDHQGRGIGTHLVVDALTWMRRRGALRAVVNTQPDNDAAIALYRRLGFRLQPVGLDVLACRLG
jgi:ribosomal protein S18 acetylase RimI-like enzyme